LDFQPKKIKDMLQLFKYLTFTLVIVFAMYSCQEAPKAKEVKKLPSNNLQFQISGSNKLDVTFSVVLPEKKVKEYSFNVEINQLGDKKDWKDTTWKHASLDTGLTSFLTYIHDLPFEGSRNATYVYKNNGFNLEEAFQGDEIDTALLRVRMLSLIEKKEGSVNLAKEAMYVKPKYTKDSKELVAAKQALERCLNSSFSFSHNGRSFYLNRTKIGPWLGLDENLKVKVDFFGAQAYMQNIASQIEKPLSEILADLEKLDPADSTAQTVFPRMNIAQEIDEMIKQILKGSSVSKEIVFVNRSLPKGIKQGLKDFVEVSIMEQKLWVFRGGSLILETDVVTGNEKLERNTPVGDFKILFKTRDKVLKGPGYASFVSYWMPFYQGYGLHDATWRRRFGASIYQDGGSHGCVNIPPKMAPVVYQNVEVGMPVIIRN
jgi:hypothetical protein